MAESPKIFPLGDRCVTVDFGNEISVDLNTRAIGLASHFQRNPFPGLIEAVPAYASVALFYDLLSVDQNFPEFDSAFDAVCHLVRSAVSQAAIPAPEGSGRLIEIPVDFGNSSASDLETVAELSGITATEVVDRFTARTYRVYMIGFLPGFAYMGEVDDSIAVPRKESPRRIVPKGSVGIAGRQTGIYPLDSPGGWQIIGRTDAEMLIPDRDPPCVLRPGDEVRFMRVK